MSNAKKTAIWGSAVLAGGALLTLFLLPSTHKTGAAIGVGYAYALCFGAAFGLTHLFLGRKLEVFSTAQQWLLRSLIYTVALGAAYLAGLVIQTVVLLPENRLHEAVSVQLWQGLIALVAIPFSPEKSEFVITSELRSLLFPAMAMLLLIGAVSLVGSFVQLRWQENRKEAALHRAELAALRAQIEPHFLFNSLNTIASLIRSNPEQAEHLLIQLSQILRHLFQHARQESISLGQELEFTRKYLALLQARFGDTLHVAIEQNIQQLDTTVPVLLMQPLVENAVHHGWKDRQQPLHISIRIDREGRTLVVKIHDNGSGIPAARLRRLPVPGHALENLSERLKLMFHQPGLLQIDSREGEGTTVTIKIPVEKK